MGHALYGKALFARNWECIPMYTVYNKQKLFAKMWAFPFLFVCKFLVFVEPNNGDAIDHIVNILYIYIFDIIPIFTLNLY